MVKKPERVQFLEALNNAVDSFIDHSNNRYNKIIAISHNDADGISSLQIIQNLLYNMHIDYDYFIYNRSVSWANYLDGILPKNQTAKTSLIFTDVGSNLSELIPIIKKRREDFYILDHHEVDDSIDLDKIPENLFFVNPTVYGFDGLDDMAGAALSFMFAKEIKSSTIKYGWLAVIGIAGDSLKPMDKLQSFNYEVYQEMISEEIIEDKEGLILFGKMDDSIKNGLKYSILPFVETFGGNEENRIDDFLKKIGVNPDKKIIDLMNNEIQKITKNSNLKKGHFALLPQKQGLLRYAFEHALLLNILSFKNISAALSIIQQKSITRYAKSIYNDYIRNLTHNLYLISNNIPRFETEKAVFIDVGGGRIPPSNWSDTASFSTVNNLIDPKKMLFLGGLEQKTQMIKLSIRCSRDYLKISKGIGVNKAINKIKLDFGGTGGGHKLAGGIRISKPSFQLLKTKIDNYI